MLTLIRINAQIIAIANRGMLRLVGIRYNIKGENPSESTIKNDAARINLLRQSVQHPFNCPYYS
ncbi:hypothetical protein KVE49_01645 [Helicobacter pylori]|nr:hypothetical protein KVE49_01645 [Helicobacter pylori]